MPTITKEINPGGPNAQAVPMPNKSFAHLPAKEVFSRAKTNQTTQLTARQTLENPVRLPATACPIERAARYQLQTILLFLEDGRRTPEA